MDVRFLSAAFLSVITLLATGPARAATAAPRANELAQVALTQAQVIKRFEAATGRRLVVDARSGNAGHYSALRLARSGSNAALYGDFTLWVVAPGTLAEDIARLLTNVHTGVLGAPGAAGIYWEQGTYLGGQTYWLGKKRYGANLVVWRYGAEPKVDPSFKRLHAVMLTRVLTSA